MRIYLIGMPGSGKSVVGEIVAELMKFCFYDIDLEIERSENNTISDIFSKSGEHYFRRLETELLFTTKTLENAIISCGGGIITNKINIEFLKQNGIVIYIKRDISKINIDNSRPLVKNIYDLETLFSARKTIYENCADYILENNSDLSDIIQNFEKLIINNVY